MRLKAAKTTFGPTSYETRQKQDAIRDEVSTRTNYLVVENQKGIQVQLDQTGYCVIDGFLGGSANGYPDQIRDEMKALWNRGWFEEETEAARQFKVGEYQILNNDTDHRFCAKLLGANPGEDAEKYVETQYEVAPTLVNFTRSLLVSLAGPIAKAAGGEISTNIGVAELIALCGNGARYDRRVSNVYGWNTQQGFAPDPRKLTLFYFANPNYREELGGHLQLEGVISPTGAASVAPFHDRLVMFWADKTVWSMRPSQATTISEHQFALHMELMAANHKLVKYDPVAFARWFPELRNMPMDWPPPNLPQPY